MRAKFFLSTIVLMSTVGLANAQYYYGNYYDSGNYWGGNNPNNGVVTFQGDSNWNSAYNYGYNNYNYGYNNYNYVQPVSVNVPNNYYSQYYNTPYYNNLTYYNYSSLSPTTYAATNVGLSNATINGYVSVSGGNNNQNYGTTWFQYGVNQNNLNWSTSPANVYYTTNTNAHLTSLNCGTTYYFRAVTSGQNGIQYGNVLAFTTTQCNYSGGYYQPYPNYNYQTWQPPRVQTICHTKKKRYYR